MLPLPFRRSSIVALGALAAVACGNISLSSSNSGAETPTTGINDIDASTDAGPANLGALPADAGTPLVVTGNPLCNYGYVDTAAHTCQPDSDDTSVQCMGVTDAGAVEGSVVPVDAGSGGGNDDDAGGATGASDAGAPTVDAGPITMPACHVVEADGGTGQTQTCTVSGTGGEGDQCQASTDCAATYECVGMPGQCRHYCCDGNSVCSATNAPSFCDVQPVVSGKFDVPVCMPISECALFGKCPTNQTCAVVKDDGTTSCVDVGTANVGEPCDEVHCAEGLTCLGNEGSRTCFQLCHVDSTTECPSDTTCTGSAQLFKDPQFGICQ